MAKYSPDTSHWDEDDGDEGPDDVSPLTTLDDHEVSVVHDPYEGRRIRYRAHIAHSFEDSPVVTLTRRGRWKGNYWREFGDPIDWMDVPTAVQLTVARVVDGASVPGDLDPGDRFWSDEEADDE